MEATLPSSPDARKDAEVLRVEAEHAAAAVPHVHVRAPAFRLCVQMLAKALVREGRWAPEPLSTCRNLHGLTLQRAKCHASRKVDALMRDAFYLPCECLKNSFAAAAGGGRLEAMTVP